MSVALVHYFHTKSSSVKDVSPGVNHSVLRVHDGLVEVEAVQVEGHGADAHGCEPDADNRPGAQEEVKACLLYTSPSPRDVEESRMPSSA